MCAGLRHISLVLSAAAAAAAAQAAQAAAQSAQAAQAAATQAQPVYHVLELQNSETCSADALLNVITNTLGAEREKALPLIEKIDKKGKAVVLAGPKASCEEAAAHFEEIGLKTEVRPLEATDMPSEYDDSDVEIAGAKQLSEALKEGEGLMVVFHAPWCGHCRTMVPAAKEAATTLKEQGVRVLAVDGQVSPAVVQQLGVQAFPAVLWLQMGDELMVAEHVGARDAASLVEFAAVAKETVAKAKAAREGGATAAEAGGAAAEAGGAAAEAGGAAAEAGVANAATESASKLRESKVAQSKVGMSTLAGTKAAEGTAGGAKPAQKPAGAAESTMGVQKAKTPAQAEASPEASPAAKAAAPAEPAAAEADSCASGGS